MFKKSMLLFATLFLLLGCTKATVTTPQSKANDYEQVMENPNYQLHYFTDPLCSACYLFDKPLSQYLENNPDSFEFHQHMVGMVKDKEVLYNIYGSEQGVKDAWDKVSKQHNIKLNSAVWDNTPVYSSYPASIAVKAAELQDEELSHHYLIAIRKALFEEGKDISDHDTLIGIAESLPTGNKTKLSIKQLESDINNAAEIEFHDDLEFKQQLKIRSLPSLVMIKDGNVFVAEGYMPYEGIEDFVNQAFERLK